METSPRPCQTHESSGADSSMLCMKRRAVRLDLSGAKLFILQKFLICIPKKDRLNLHEEAVPEVSNIPWRLHELSAALESCRNPDGERQRKKKKRLPNDISKQSFQRDAVSQ